MDHDDIYGEDHGFDVESLYGFDAPDACDPREAQMGLTLGKGGRVLTSEHMLTTTANWRTPYQRA